MQGRGQSAFGPDEFGEPAQPADEGFEWFVRGGQGGRGVGAGIDLMSKDGRDQVGALWEVAVEGGEADPGPGGDLAYRSVHARDLEDLPGRVDQRVDVASRIGADATCPFGCGCAHFQTPVA